ncbi:MAG: sigma-54-dependent transcriptional regulator [Thiotrichales bacterium]
MNILLIEDELVFAKAVCRRLEAAGYRCTHVATLAGAWQRLRLETPDLILLDMRLPDGGGLEFLQRLREDENRAVAVVVMTAYGEIEDAVAAMKLGALDYLKKPLDLNELLLVIERAARQSAANRRLEYSRQREARAGAAVEMLGESPSLRAARERLEQVAMLADRAGDPPTVLLLGETGIGKDLAARLLHHHSRRRERPFVHVDCATLPRELIEAELFGHERGAYTGAQTQRVGLVEAAEDGVLFLDEICELPLELQTKLLALLERRVYRRLGGTLEQRTTAWIVAATNRPVDQMVASGSLRADLYYRLRVLTLRLPALRERRDDIALLARHFLERTARRFGLATPRLTPECIAALQRYDWPGNVRELVHVIERAVLLGGDTLSVVDLGLGDTTFAPTPANAEPPDSAASTLDAAEAALIRRALERHSGNVSAAARELGITRMTLRYRIEKHAIATKTEHAG